MESALWITILIAVGFYGLMTLAVLLKKKAK
jgi:hypothetical protein